jgi:hypothetical protein
VADIPSCAPNFRASRNILADVAGHRTQLKSGHSHIPKSRPKLERFSKAANSRSVLVRVLLAAGASLAVAAGDAAAQENNLLLERAMYHDDRMFLLNVSKCTIAVDGNVLETTVYHEGAPQDHIWCLVTYRNVAGYPPVRVDHFETAEAARSYLERVEPTVPRLSLGGQSPTTPLPYDRWLEWKANNGLKDYDHRKQYMPGAYSNPREIIFSRMQ